MARLVLDNLEPDIVEKLELRAKRLGTTPEKEASRLLGEGLRAEPEPERDHEDGAQADGTEADPRFVRRHGFLMFTGEIAAEDVPDHRALRDERVDSLLKGAGSA
ncbi:uncharacterized protein SOCE26_064020 [Sorangium cellulosum]|uniref:Plasmid stabilization protein n=1 Tax=Sorangium cellulosum TaxID=56 RepID=A0A2L0F045_SORCE|nr:hypothetical protein [Sorangium cellulosum]AUX44932.1 uncharacterized protein SOCE26_064020 [Sorangium cellulosum]